MCAWSSCTCSSICCALLVDRSLPYDEPHSRCSGPTAAEAVRCAQQQPEPLNAPDLHLPIHLVLLATEISFGKVSAPLFSTGLGVPLVSASDSPHAPGDFRLLLCSPPACTGLASCCASLCMVAPSRRLVNRALERVLSLWVARSKPPLQQSMTGWVTTESWQCRIGRAALTAHSRLVLASLLPCTAAASLPRFMP